LAFKKEGDIAKNRPIIKQNSPFFNKVWNHAKGKTLMS
jgi:hypothetical protein